jgi:cytochrome P450
LLYAISIAVYNIYFHPLSVYPGPKSYAASRIPYVRTVLAGGLPFSVRRLHEEYGDVVRIGPDELSYTNAEAWKDIYGHRIGKSQIPKDQMFYSPPVEGVSGILTTDDAKHARMRKLLSNAFSEKTMRTQEPTMKHYIDLLIQRLKENCDNGKAALNMTSWYTWTTFDLIGDLTLGESFSCLENSSYHPWVKMIFPNTHSGIKINATRRFPLPQFTQKFLPKHLFQARAAHANMTAQMTEKRMQRAKEGKVDFISHILKRDAEGGLAIPEIKSTISLLVIAGSETTATLLSGVTYMLLKNPCILAKLKDEVRSAFQDEDEITIVSVGNLNYMLAVLNEALRMYPPVPGGLSRRTGDDGDIILGQYVPPQVSASFMLNIF